MTLERHIDHLLAEYTGNVPGAAVAVVRDGDVVFAKGYGLAAVEAEVPVTTRSNFRLASMTKQFIAAAITILHERGTLSYDDSIARWLPSLPASTNAITIRQLLTHTSGLVDYEDLIPEAQTEQVLDADVLRLLESADRTLFTPGEKYQYSNSGYVLLGLIIERASGLTLGEFLDREIFAKRGMRGSVLMDRGAAIATRAYGHDRNGASWMRRDQSVTSATRGDGAIYSSIDDLARWDASLRDVAFTPFVETGEPGVSYGFGWRMGTYRDRRMVWHTGETMGFRNAIIRFPDDRLTVILLTNRNEGEPIAIAKKIADFRLGR
jgi:CubicO group peptidase (beta-lactamase class C family)